MQSPIPLTSNFPAADVEASIRNALAAQQSTQQVLRPLEPGAWEPEVDSLVVIEVICAIEELIGVSLPTSFAPRGGYNDVEACVSDLVAQTQAVWSQVVKVAEKHNA